MTPVSHIGWLTQEHVLRCPGCQKWQLHYTWLSLQDLIAWNVPSSPQEPLNAALEPAKECVEVILRDHVAHECPSPRKVLELWKKAARRST